MLSKHGGHVITAACRTWRCLHSPTAVIIIYIRKGINGVCGDLISAELCDGGGYNITSIDDSAMVSRCNGPCSVFIPYHLKCEFAWTVTI